MREKILVVEDEKDIQEVIAAFLGAAGYEVIRAGADIWEYQLRHYSIQGL